MGSPCEFFYCLCQLKHFILLPFLSQNAVNVGKKYVLIVDIGAKFDSTQITSAAGLPAKRFMELKYLVGK